MSTIIDNLRKDAEALTWRIIRATMPEARMVDVDVYWNMETIGMTWDCTEHRIAGGTEKVFFEKLGLKVCKKRDAQICIEIGEKQGGCFVIGQYKRYWMTPITPLP